MAVQRLTDYTRRIWTALDADAPEGHDFEVGDVIYYMDSSQCGIVTYVYPEGSIDVEFLPDIGGGGGGGDEGEIVGDYFDVQYAYVTSGPNTISNTAQVYPYLRGLAGIETPAAGYYTVVDDPGGWIYDEVIGTNVGANTMWRYRSGAFTAVQSATSYTARIPEGKRYLVVAVFNKGAPSV